MLPDIYNTSLLLACPVNLAGFLIGRFSMSLQKLCLRVISQLQPIMEVRINSMQLYLMDAIFSYTKLIVSLLNLNHVKG